MLYDLHIWPKLRNSIKFGLKWIVMGKKVYFFLTFLVIVYIILYEVFYFIHIKKMRNKKLFGLFCSVLIVSLCFFWRFSSAIEFNVNLWDSRKILTGNHIDKKISPIYFKDKWNDFGWFMYFNNFSWGNYVVEWDWSEKKYECGMQAWWFYYNAQRWDRLWPLDKNTAEKWDMLDDVLSGGIYTRCRLSGYNSEIEECGTKDNEDERELCERRVKDKYSDAHGYFWKIDHEYSWQKMGLLMGTDYDLSSWWVVATGWLHLSLIRIANQFPVWFIYDYNWWAWFVWCNVLDMWGAVDAYHNQWDWNKIFELNIDWTWLRVKDDFSSLFSWEKVWSAKDTLLSIIVEWIVWMWKNTKNDGYIWNLSNTKTQLFSSVDINNTKLINYARQKAETLCRGKWNKSVSDDVVCKSGFTINADEYGNRTLIVKWGDVKITPNNVYDIFVDGWNLVIEENSEDVLSPIMSNWFKSSSTYSNFQSLFDFYQKNVEEDGGLNFNMTDCISCAMLWGCEDYSMYGAEFSAVDCEPLRELALNDWKNTPVSLASIIKWNFIINWNVKWETSIGGESESKLKNKYFIYWKFTTKDTFNDLEKVFTWRCNKWKDTNNKTCLQLGINPYSDSALTIIDQDYNSPLFK